MICVFWFIPTIILPHTRATSTVRRRRCRRHFRRPPCLEYRRYGPRTSRQRCESFAISSKNILTLQWCISQLHVDSDRHGLKFWCWRPIGYGVSRRSRSPNRLVQDLVGLPLPNDEEQRRPAQDDPGRADSRGRGRELPTGYLHLAVQLSLRHSVRARPILVTSALFR